jgi:lipid-binding SYLF domain-containing protein
MRYHRSRYVLALVASLALAGSRPGAQELSEEAKRIQNATEVLQELTSAPDDGIPQHLLERAEAVVVIPSLVKGGFVVGAKHGKGIISVRNPSAKTWTAPGFVNMTGGSIGWQVGIEAVDLVLLVMNRNGVSQLLEDRFTLGGDLSIAAGPVGRSTAAATNAQVNAQILAYSRAKGLFLGATFEGAALHEDKDANRAFYGSPLTLREIVTPDAPRTNVPTAASGFTDMLQKVAQPAAGTTGAGD